MEPPPGYPPPTLVRKRSRSIPLKIVFLFMLLFAAVGYFAVNTLLDRGSVEAPPVRPVPIEPSGAGSADTEAAALPDTAEGPDAGIIVEKPIEDGAATGNARDARRPNQWYFVGRLGEGPGAIYSRDGGQWDFAFACTTRTRMIEFIAVGTGEPGTFTGQTINVGGFRLDMEATYARDSGGMISTTLPASHDFFTALDGSTPMEVHLVANRKTIVPIGPAVTRLIQDCRGRT